jgi:hypothetical protein
MKPTIHSIRLADVLLTVVPELACTSSGAVAVFSHIFFGCVSQFCAELHIQ